MHKNFVGFDHTYFRAGALFNHFQTITQVAQLGAKPANILLGTHIGVELLLVLLTQSPNIRNTAAPKP